MHIYTQISVRLVMMFPKFRPQFTEKYFLRLPRTIARHEIPFDKF